MEESRCGASYFLPVVVLRPFLGPVGRVQPMVAEPMIDTSNSHTNRLRADIANSFRVKA